MPNKRYQCRSHQGGIFSMPSRRGRPPVRCTSEHTCDRAMMEQDGLPSVPNFDSMSNTELKAYAREHFSTISKITSRVQLISAMEAQLAKQATVSNVVREVPSIGKVAVVTTAKAPESVPKPSAAVNDSLPLAKAAKERLEPVGWIVKGRAWIDNGQWAEITCSRDAETLIIRWRDGVLADQQYSMESLRQSENGIPPHKLSFDPNELTDSELVRMVRGCKVTWWNSIASSQETAIIAAGNISVEHIFVGGGNTDDSKRIIKFLDHSGGGFRAFHVGALLKVG